MRVVQPLRRVAVFSFLLLTSYGARAAFSQASLPNSTAIPVMFTRTMDAGKAAPGTSVTAKTLQALNLPSGLVVPKGTVVEGHVVEGQPFKFDSTPYAHQQPSYLSVQFDRIDLAGGAVPAHFAVRAMADYFSTDEALRPKRLDEIDHVGTMELIGGGEYSPLETVIKGDNGDAIAYNRKHGVFARLIASEYTAQGSAMHCSSTDTEQSVAIFSPGACGLYGFPSLVMTRNGREDGVARFESRNHTVQLRAYSAALLQVLPAESNTASNMPSE